MKNDFTYGGMISNTEWNNYDVDKYCIAAYGNNISIKKFKKHRHFLAFHSEEAAKRFIEEYPELVKQYLGIEDDVEL